MAFPKKAGSYDGFVTSKQINKSSNGFLQLEATLILKSFFDKASGKVEELVDVSIPATINLAHGKGINFTQCNNLAEAFGIGPVEEGFIDRLHKKDVSNIPIRAKIDYAIDKQGKRIKTKKGEDILEVSFINPIRMMKAQAEDVKKWLDGGALDWMTRDTFKPIEKKEEPADQTEGM